MWLLTTKQQPMIEANNPSLKSWIHVKADSDFPIQNLPFGVFRRGSNDAPRGCVAIGDYLIPLADILDKGLFSGEGKEAAKAVLEILKIK